LQDWLVDLRTNHTEPQNHRIVGVGRDLWRSLSTTTSVKQVHLEQAVQDCVQTGFEYP